MTRDSSRTDRATVGLYGKHPTAADFLRLNAASVEVQHLDEWLSGALAAAQRLVPGWETVYPAASPISFISNQDEATGRSLVGLLVPSRDASGRQYPLVIFSEVEDALLVRTYPAIPCHRFMLDMERLLERRKRIHHDKLLSSVQALQPPAAESLLYAQQELERYLERTACGTTLETMFGGDAAVEQGAIGLGTLQEFCRALWPGRPLPGWGVRCPLGSFPAGTAALWLSLVQQWLPRPLVPNAIWSRNTLLIYFSRLSTKALTALWHIGWHDDSLCNLATTRGEGTSLTIDPEQPLQALLARHGHR